MCLVEIVFVPAEEGPVIAASSWRGTYGRSRLTRWAARALALRRRLGVGLDVDVLLALVVGLDLDDVVVPRHRVEGSPPRCAMAISR